MSSPAPAVAVLGAGLLGDRIAERIQARPDLEMAARSADSTEPPAGTGCVVYVPSFAEIASKTPETVLPRLLRDGYNVISTAPFDSDIRAGELRDACRAGDSTFHATGAFQTTIPARLIRSLAEVTRDIRRVEIVEELDLPGTGVYPWGAVTETGIGTPDTAAAACAAVVDGYYTAGLRVVDEVVFGGAAGAVAIPSHSVDVVTGRDGLVEKVIVARDLGPSLSYRSVWSAATTDRAPLRYRLTTTTDSAKGTANVRFRCTEGLHPADHLTCGNVVEAIRPVHAQAAGIAPRDLAITHLVPDDRLTG
ncbi:hypothetical protein [Nocardia sp. NPDC051750]|uniref:hypothetical protein n=1 Tax=Nocardia sp. NPDC051750 TaxID=3364325 RepID=UPI0037985F08